MKYLVKMYQTNLIYFVMQLPQIIFKLFLTQVGFDGPMNVILRIRLMIQLCMLNLVILSILIRSLYEQLYTWFNQQLQLWLQVSLQLQSANKSINRHGSRQHWSRLLTVALAGNSCSSSWLQLQLQLAVAVALLASKLRKGQHDMALTFPLVLVRK